MIRTLLLLALIPLSLLSWPAHAEATATSATEPAQAAGPIVLVRILSLEGIGPDLKEHRLFSAPKGFVTTLDALGRVGSQVSGAGLAEGGYHTLYAQLADEYEVIQPDGAKTQRRFSDENKTTRVRVRGMILVRGGQATPLRMLEDSPYYGSRKWRGGEEDDD